MSIGFLPFEITDLLDIIIVAVILYKVYQALKGTAVIRLFIGILFFIVCWLLVTYVFQMRLLGSIMNQIINVGVIALIVLFQDELRQFLTVLGSHRNYFMRQVSKAFSTAVNKTMQDKDIMQVVMACKNMAYNKVGALIVIPQENNLRYVLATGERIDARISTRLIENIFFKNTPLHDGAMVMGKDSIMAAGCILPVTHNMHLPEHMGLRHRAAVGITEKSDACVIIVSEETGHISWAQLGKIDENISQEKLEGYLSKSITNINNDQSF